MQKVFLLSLALLAAPSLFSNHIYVNAAATGANTGLSWADAFVDLQQALLVAEAGDEVWVAEGTYLPTTTTNRSISFKPASGVRLFGGFAGTETNLDQRDWTNHPTILSGQIGGPLLNDNSFHILVLSDPDSSTVIDGLIFQYGYASGQDLDRSGAAILAVDTGGTAVLAPRIRNCRFMFNQSIEDGAAVFLYHAAVDLSRFENCYFQQNKARSGGAVYVLSDDCRVRFSDCTFFQNEANGKGGAVSGEAGSLRFERCHFEENTTEDYASAVFIRAGTGMAPRFLDCQFVRNLVKSGVAGDGDGAVQVDLAGADSFLMARCNFIENKCLSIAGSAGLTLVPGTREGVQVRIADCTFTGNEAPNGGRSVLIKDFKKHFKTIEFERCRFSQEAIVSIFMHGSGSADAPLTVRLDSCVFERIEGPDGVLRLNLLEHTWMEIQNSIFQQNKVVDLIDFNAPENLFSNCIFQENDGYELFTTENGHSRFENCLFRKNTCQLLLFGIFESSMEFSHCLFDSNTTVDDGPISFFTGEAVVYNSVFQNNTGTQLGIPQYLNPHFEHCYFGALSPNLPPAFSFGPGNLSGLDPLFANAAAGDFRLQPCSPLIHAGDNDHTTSAIDLAGLLRITGGRVDIGPYEATGPGLAVEPIVTPACSGLGAVALEPANGCFPYSIVWATAGGQSGQQQNNLPPGDYVFTISDSRGSEYSLALTVPPPVTLHVLAIPVLCGDTLGGSASAGVLSGTPPFQYQWPDGGNPDSLRTGLAAGAYLLTVTDASGCSAEAVAEVEKLGNLSVAIQVDAISCHTAADGSFTVLPENGKSPFAWNWADGSMAPTLGPLGPGDYLGTLTDALGCTLGWILPLEEPDSLRANPQVTPATDSLSANGSATLVPAGGTPPYTAGWSNGANGLTINNLAPGTYTATLVDAHGCTTMETITVGITVSWGNIFDEQAGIRIFPNPASAQFVLEGLASETGTGDWTLSDAAGRTFKSLAVPLRQAPFRITVPVSDLPTGCYVWRFTTRFRTQSGKIVIQ